MEGVVRTGKNSSDVRRWHTFDALGDRLCQGCRNGQRFSRLDAFLMMFPPTQLNDLICFIDMQLEKKGEPATTQSEMTKFLGIAMSITRFKFNKRRDL